ncbi:MAG TPA: SAM-dependent methyltransferase, partial [Sphingobium sp.]
MNGIGTIHGVGLGPGAQDLMCVRADRLIRSAGHIAYFRKAGRSGHARRIVEGMLRPDVIEFPMEYPVTTEIPLTDPRYNACLSAFYADCTDHLHTLAKNGEDVVVLCEGDPFFYGSFMHLHSRLSPLAPVRIV